MFPVGFLMFSGGIEVEQWLKMGEIAKSDFALAWSKTSLELALNLGLVLDLLYNMLETFLLQTFSAYLQSFELLT